MSRRKSRRRESGFDPVGPSPRRSVKRGPLPVRHYTRTVRVVRRDPHETFKKRVFYPTQVIEDPRNYDLAYLEQLSKKKEIYHPPTFWKVDEGLLRACRTYKKKRQQGKRRRQVLAALGLIGVRGSLGRRKRINRRDRYRKTSDIKKRCRIS